MKCLYCGQEIGPYDTICRCCGAPLTGQKETAETDEERNSEQSKEEDIGENVSEQVLHEGNSTVENKPNKTTKYIILALLALLVCCAGGYVLCNMTSSEPIYYADAELTDSADTNTGATNMVEEADKEEKILKCAEYIFKNLPDHRWLDEVDKSVFSPSFLEVLEKASALHKKHLNEGCLAMDRIDYWYVGQDGCFDDGLQGISLLSENDETAVVEVKYKNCNIEKHKMSLVYSDGQWLCDNWDNMKEGLLEDMKDLSMDTHTEGSLKLDIFRCVVDSIRGRVGPGIEYEEDEDWWSNVERGDKVWYLNNTTNDYRECLIRGYRGSLCIIWIPKDCLEPTGEQEEMTWSLKELEQFGYVK
jgi:hypothetical protein